EFFRECRFLLNNLDNGCLLKARNHGIGHGRDGRDTLRLSGKAALTEEFVGPKNADNRFLALLGYDSELYFALLDVKDSIGAVALRKYDLVLAVLIHAM